MCANRPWGPGWAAPHLLSLLDLRQHHDGVAFPLPDHPPEVLHRVRQGPLRGDEIVLLSVALRMEQRSQADFLPRSHHRTLGFGTAGAGREKTLPGFQGRARPAVGSAHGRQVRTPASLRTGPLVTHHL